MNKVNLMLRTECNLFFQENPYAYETIEGLAIRLGRKADHLRPIVEELVSLSILEKIGDGERSIFRYIEPEITNGMDDMDTFSWNRA
jgi:hypothetical protein